MNKLTNFLKNFAIDYVIKYLTDIKDEVVKKLNKEIVKDFISRNKDRLFNLGIEITKKPGSVWFLIKSSSEEESTARYTYDGSILEGIVQYLEIVNHMKKRDNM